MAVKYKMTFVNAQEITCVVNFIVDDDVYSEDPIILYGGARPFVLAEYNQDYDFYKPIRPQQATIEILASASGAELEDFITSDDDRQIKVRFDFGEWIGYWHGVLSQEDMSEIFIAQNHIITLRADEGFGVLKTIPLQNDIGQQLSGTFTPFTLLQYAATETVRTFFNCYIYSNLFHSSMNSGSKQTGIDQCLIDARTFEQSPNVFDDSYTVIEKINSAFNQTLFQYDGDWWIMRQEEMYIPSTENLTGFQLNKPAGQRANRNTRYTINVGVNKKVKPIMPEMLKTLNKPSKKTSIKWSWSTYDNILCNQKFSKGEQILTRTGPTGEELYFVDDWSFETNSILSPTIINAPTAFVDIANDPYERINYFYRSVYYQNYNLKSEYIAFGDYYASNKWIRSCNVYVTAGDNIDISYEFLLSNSITPNNIKTGVIILYADDGTKYTIDGTTRQWSICNNTNDIKYLQVAKSTLSPTTELYGPILTFSSGKFEMKYNDETNIQVQPIPKTGYINVILLTDPAVGANLSSTDLVFFKFKSLDVVITPEAQRNREKVISSDTDSYTIQGNFKKNTDKEIFLSDGFYSYKGSLLKGDQKLTNGQWFRRRLNTESYTFKRHNAIANWMENRRYKLRLECNFFGLIWDKDDIDYPIGLVNTINLSDDLPSKTFAIVNLREIDFMNCTWSANLLEIWDDELDDTITPSNSDIYNYEFFYE